MPNVCAERVYPTQEEIEAEEADFNRAFENVAKARDAIVAKHGKARGLASQMPCPVCSVGVLGYLIAGSNGHIRAACCTDEACVRPRDPTWPQGQGSHGASRGAG